MCFTTNVSESKYANYKISEREMWESSGRDDAGDTIIVKSQSSPTLTYSFSIWNNYAENTNDYD